MADLVKTESNVPVISGADFQIPTGHICTIDMSTLDGKLAVAAALNGAVTMKDKVGEVLLVTNFVTTPGVRSRTGEACTNTYLECDDGTVYFTQSDGIARSVKVIVGAFIDQNTGEFKNPVELGVGVRIDSQELPNGNTLKKAVPVRL